MSSPYSGKNASLSKLSVYREHSRPGMAEKVQMIRREGFSKGDRVEFQDYRHCWQRGVVEYIELGAQRIEGPGGTIVQSAETAIHVRYYDPFNRSWRVKVLPLKRVRLVKE
jgi:hypothetical protein